MAGLILGLFAVACSTEEYPAPDESALPTLSGVSDQIKIEVDDQNFVHFDYVGKANVAAWTFGETDMVTRNTYKRQYMMAGTYSVEVKLYNANGISDGSVVKEFVVDRDYLTILLSNNSSKKWIFDSTKKGYLGCGPSGGDGLGWWSADANSQTSSGLYDDVMTFNSDATYTFSAGADGLTYVNKDSGYKNEYKTGGADYQVPVADQNASFTIKQEGADYFLVFAPNTILPYIPNPEALTNPKYKIVGVSEDKLELTIDNGGITWHYRFVPQTATE